jgi:hypothetical protein
MLRAIDRWLPGYLASVLRRPKSTRGTRHVLICVADHFEPFDRTILPDGSITGGADAKDALGLVNSWCGDYASALGGFCDADGLPPRHTFFYPWDEYDAACLDRLAEFRNAGFGEVEIHLHHRNDTEEGFREKLIQARDTYALQHGLLGRRRSDGTPAYAFVHGNWCLCNSRPDGDWCGVNGEMAILKETGCYADLTFPSAPSTTQPRFVNAVCYGKDPEPGERGPRCGCRMGSQNERGDGVLMLPGPLGLNWGSRKWGIFPRLENAELSGSHAASEERLRLWLKIGIHVPPRTDWVVVKLHTHGAVPANRNALLGPPMIEFHRTLENLVRGGDLQIHYLTARELFNILKAAEAGESGNPGDYRDYIIESKTEEKIGV